MLRWNFIASLMIGTAISPVTVAGGNEGRTSPAPTTYCAYDIGQLAGLPPGETYVSLGAINNRNQIVGWTGIAGSGGHAFIWDRKHGMRDLGSLPGRVDLDPVDINDAGTVIGEMIDTVTDRRAAFIWNERTGIRELDVSLGGALSLPKGINRSGQIVGASQTATGEFHAFLRDVNGDVLDLGSFEEGDYSSAVAVNDRGQVAGFRSNGAIFEAFLWDERHGKRILEHGALTLYPADINGHGTIVGGANEDPSRALRWTKREGLRDLGSLSGGVETYATATAINLSGAIVGASVSTTGAPHAFVWSRRSGMRDLNDLIDPSSDLGTRAVLVIAQAINDAGWILVDGYVQDAADPQRGFLLVPRRHDSTRECRLR